MNINQTGFRDTAAILPDMASLADGELLAVFAAIGRQVSERFLAGRKVLTSWKLLVDYLSSAMAGSEREEFRVLFLDKRNALIADEIMQTGTVDHVPVYPREIVKRALELSSTAVILVHNHPSGDPTPSAADVTMTKEIVKACAILGISVHDHVVIGKAGHASMRSLKLI